MSNGKPTRVWGTAVELSDRFTPDLMKHFEMHNLRVEKWLKARVALDE